MLTWPLWILIAGTAALWLSAGARRLERLRFLRGQLGLSRPSRLESVLVLLVAPWHELCDALAGRRG